MLILNLITSKNNEKIKETAKLFCSSKMRSQNGLFVIEGIRLCYDAYLSNAKIKSVFITEKCLNKSKIEANKIIESADTSYIVTEEIIKHISDTVTPQGIVCVCEQSENQPVLKENVKIAVLVDVQDPANIGTISRTAEAFGIDMLIVNGGCDVYNPKALRASMGALFRLPVLSFNEVELFDFISCNKIKTFASTPRNSAKKITDVDFNGKCAMFIGNEANGLSDEIIKKCDEMVTIPMLGRAESLNAAAAASVLMFEMVRGSL